MYGFLAFAGFEGAAALGEETSEPKTQIPRAIKTAVVVVGAFYLLTAASQSLGYGATAAGAKAFGAGLPFSDLGNGYIGKWYADILDLMATISLFAISLGVASGAARIMYAQARDGAGKGNRLARLSRHGQPSAALVVVLVIFALALVGQQLAGSTVDQRDLLCPADRHRADPRRLRDGHRRRDPLPVLQGRAQGPRRGRSSFPLLGGAFVCYTIYRNTLTGQVGDLRPPALDRARLPGHRARRRCHGGPGTGPSRQGRTGRWDDAVTRIACQQLAPVLLDLEANRALTGAAIEEAVAAGADVVVLPELISSGYVFESAAEAASVAIGTDHPLIAGWVRAAARADIVLAAGFCERGEDGATYNSAVLIDGTGLRAVYRKLHLWDREKLWFAPGTDLPPVVDTRVGRVSLLICYDLEFPELTRTVALDGNAAAARADQLAAHAPARTASGRPRSGSRWPRRG